MSVCCRARARARLTRSSSAHCLRLVSTWLHIDSNWFHHFCPPNFGVKLVLKWCQLGFTLVSNWFHRFRPPKFGFKLVSNWFQIGFRLVSPVSPAELRSQVVYEQVSNSFSPAGVWFHIGFKLVSNWFRPPNFGFKLVSNWIQIGLTSFVPPNFVFKLVSHWCQIGFTLVSPVSPDRCFGSSYGWFPRHQRPDAGMALN